MQSSKQVYVLSLDSVDLNLLPMSYKQSCNKIAPLLTKSNLNSTNNEYYTFKIKKIDNSIETKIHTTKYLTCNICDIEVPKLFFNEHKKSFRHKFNMKIVEVALERLQKQILVENELDDEEENSISYFCPQCSIIIDSDKTDHDKSNTHKNSILLEKFLNDFLYFYTNETEVNEDDLQAEIEPVIEESNKLDTEVISKVDPLIKDKKKEENLNNNNVKQEIGNLNKFKQEVVKGNNVLTKNNEKAKLTTKEYIDILNEKYNTESMIYDVVDDNVLILTLDGSIIKVNSDQFHGLDKIEKKILECMLCKCLLKINQLQDHLLTDAHMKLVSLPLQDIHCERRISDSWKHCLICNIIITENDGYHSAHNYKHNQNLSKACIFSMSNYNKTKTTGGNENNNFRNDIKYTDETVNNNLNVTEVIAYDIASDTQFCKLCNIMINKNQVLKHENSAKHIKNSKWTNHYLINYIDNDNVSCKVCETAIDYNVTSLKSHFSNFDHIGNYDKILNLNSIRDVDGLNFYCGVCDIYFLFKHELLHIDSEEHKKNNDIENIEAEVYTDTIELIYDNRYICDICKVTVPNNDYNIIEHNNGRLHGQNLIAKKVLMRKDNPAENYKSVQTKKLHYQMIESGKGLVSCIICRVNLSYNEANISTHVAGAVHSQKYNDFLKSNFLTVTDNNVFCSVCLVKTGIRSEFSHCIGRNHNSNLLKYKITGNNVPSEN